MHIISWNLQQPGLDELFRKRVVPRPISTHNLVSQKDAANTLLSFVAAGPKLLARMQIVFAWLGPERAVAGRCIVSFRRAD